MVDPLALRSIMRENIFGQCSSLLQSLNFLCLVVSKGATGQAKNYMYLIEELYCDVPGSPCLSKNKANQVCDSFF